MKDNTERLVAADPIGRMLKMLSIALGLALAVALVRVIPDIPYGWAETAAWRVHHVPMLSTHEEQEEIRKSDHLMALVSQIKRAAQEAYTR